MASARRQVMDAVEQQGLRVTLGDITGSTGLALSEAKQELLTLAQQAEGHLQVSETGEIAYVFQPQFRQILGRKQRQSFWTQIGRKLWQICLYGVRISFGILLLLSIVLIFAALIALSMLNRDDDNDHMGPTFRFFYIPDLWLFWNPYPYDYSHPRRSRNRSKGGDQDKGMNFLESVYSFLFGDGNPNADIDKRRDQLIASTIRNHGGVITGEQVLPYLDLPPNSSQLEYEDYMLPILVKFDGQPAVSEEGGIVYRFPELQVSAAKRHQKRIPRLLKEQPWVFSEAPPGQRTLAAGLGVLNFFLALILFSLREQVAAGASTSFLLAFVNPLVGLLLGYGTMFLAVPLIRWTVLKGRNRQVEARNDLRSQWADLLEEPTASLEKKLAFAEQLSYEEIVTEESTIYSTDKDLIEQRDYDLDRPEFQELEKKEQSQLTPSEKVSADQEEVTSEESPKLMGSESASEDVVETPADLSSEEGKTAEVPREKKTERDHTATE